MSRVGTVPVVLVTGIDATAMASVTIGCQWDLPRAVVVRHDLHVEAQQLHRVVSDADGVVEQVVHQLDHACVSCALREDIIPTLERLCADGRWEAVVAHLPVAAEAVQVCRLLELDPTAAPHARISSVVTALAGTTLAADLLGDDLLRERGLHAAPDDDRGVAETCSSLVEYADLLAVTGASDAEGRALLRALARPGVELVTDTSRLDGRGLLEGLHQHARTEAWVSPTRPPTVPLVVNRHTWSLELSSVRPFHPERLLDGIELLGSAGVRTRGCFWLPTRPGDVGVWDGAGGQLSIGTGSPWGSTRPFTRISVTGTTASRVRIGRLREDFDRLLLDDAEIEARGMLWEAFSDGFEPWLGAIRRAAA
ncbi:GTP-binding protein [Auraticoccus cholistanensis]